MGGVIGWLVTIKVETNGFDDEQLERLSAGLRNPGRDPGGGGFDHDMTTTLTIAKKIDGTDFRQATAAGIDTILKAFAGSGIEGRVVSLEAHIADPEVARAEIHRIFREMFLGTSEVAERLGVSRQRVSELAKTHPDFPEPVERLRSGPIYFNEDIDKFERNWERRRTGRPRSKAS